LFEVDKFNDLYSDVRAHMNPNCPRRCDCSHPSECLFAASEPERASFAVVWIVGAAVLAAVILIVLLL